MRPPREASGPVHPDADGQGPGIAGPGHQAHYRDRARRRTATRNRGSLRHCRAVFIDNDADYETALENASNLCGAIAVGIANY